MLGCVAVKNEMDSKQKTIFLVTFTIYVTQTDSLNLSGLVTMTCTQINIQNFWDTDLESLEAVFLIDGNKITDLPTNLDNRVPSQGSVLLDKAINIDNIVKQPSVISRLLFHFG